MKEKLDKAIECFKKKDWNGAIDLFTSILEVEPTNAEIYNNLGLCYANLGDDEKAEKNYLKCIELNPKIPQCYINLVDIYYKQHRLGEGINILSYAIDMLPEDLIFRHYLARFYIEDAKEIWRWMSLNLYLINNLKTLMHIMIWQESILT